MNPPTSLQLLQAAATIERYALTTQRPQRRHVLELVPTEDVVETQRLSGLARASYWGTQTLGLHPLLSYSAAWEVDESEGVWTVADRETGIFGAGPDEASAIQDFAAALVEHRSVLEREPTLSEELNLQLYYLRRVVG